MDRITALRNVETVLAAFETGEIDLGEAQRRTEAILQTFASEFEHPDRQVYRARIGDRERVVIADSRPAARQRAADSTDTPPESVSIESFEGR